MLCQLYFSEYIACILCYVDTYILCLSAWRNSLNIKNRGKKRFDTDVDSGHGHDSSTLSNIGRAEDINGGLRRNIRAKRAHILTDKIHDIISGRVEAHQDEKRSHKY